MIPYKDVESVMLMREDGGRGGSVELDCEALGSHML